MKNGVGGIRQVLNQQEIAAELLTTSQAAQLLAVGERSLWRWSRSGKAPKPIKIGSAVRYRYRELLDWIETGCQSSSSTAT